jgi:3-hydroxyisobutyrate dehydrogenase-like beta-hydroxyacid dehydrogenase
MEQKKQPIGLIGLGNAGIALATPLLKQFGIVGYDREPKRLAVARAAGIQTAESAKDVARACEIVLLSLPTPEASRSAMGEMVGQEIKGRLIIETSTVSPHDIDWLVKIATEQGATVVDSAIVGGVQKLAQGKTTFLVGASDSDYARAQPVLDAAAEEIFHLGRVGNGMRAKLVNNAVAHTTMVMIIEAAALAAKVGVPMDLFYTLMSRESGLMRPLTHRFGERIRNQDFDGGMSTANARKDSVLILDLAREMGVPLFTMQASHTVYEIANQEDLSRLDYASISKLWERWMDIHFGKSFEASND